jgi:hypothetical protein
LARGRKLPAQDFERLGLDGRAAILAGRLTSAIRLGFGQTVSRAQTQPLRLDGGIRVIHKT